LSYVSSGALH